MSKIQYINTINMDTLDFNYTEISNDYDIFKVEREGENLNYEINYIAELKKHKNEIYHILFCTGKLFYIIAKRQIFKDDNEIKNILNNIVNCDVCKIDATILKPRVLLNLLLFTTASNSKNLSNGECISNSSYFYYSSSGIIPGTVVAFDIRFVEYNNQIVLSSKVNTFTSLEKLGEHKGPYFTPGAKTLKRIYDLNEMDKSIVYVKKGNINKKNTRVAFNYQESPDNQKLIVLGRIYKELKQSKYINCIEFQKEDLEEYENMACYKFSLDYANKFFKKECLNIYIQEDLENKNEILKCLEEFLKTNNMNYSIKNNYKDDLLLVILKDNGKNDKEKDPLSDKIYEETFKNNRVTQHIGINSLFKNLKKLSINEDAFFACLKELIIKNEIKNKKINSFDFSCLDKDSKYDFYVIDKKSEKDDNGNYTKFYQITMLTTGEISFNSGLIKNDIYSNLLNRDKNISCVVVKNDNDILLIKDTDIHIIPDYNNFMDTYEKYYNSTKTLLQGNEILSIFEEIKQSNNELLEDIKEVIEDSDINGFNSYSIKDIKFKYKKKLKEIFENKLEELGYNISIIGSFKSQESIDKYYPAVEKIHYNSSQYFVANENPEFSFNKMKSNIIKKEIQILNGDESIINDVLAMMYTPNVRYKQLTVMPFPLKYINERNREDYQHIFYDEDKNGQLYFKI